MQNGIRLEIVNDVYSMSLLAVHSKTTNISYML